MKLLTPIVYLLLLCFASGLCSCTKRYGLYEMNESAQMGSQSGYTLDVDSDEIQDLEYVIQFMQEDREKGWLALTPVQADFVVSEAFQSPYLNFLLAEYFYAQGQLSRALGLLTGIDESAMPMLEVYNLKSKIFEEQGEYELAIDQVNNAILINRSDAELYDQKATIYLNMKDTLSAINYYEKSWYMDTAQVDLAIELADLYANKGDMVSAIDWLGHAENNEGSKRVKYIKIKIYRTQQMDVEANVLLEELLSGGDLTSGGELVAFFEERNQWDSALYYSDQMLEVDSMYIPALMAKAEIYDHKRYYPSAISYYESILAIDSLNQEALEGVRKVNGKIAYLRKIKERREALPSFDFISPNIIKTVD
ncbi:hypothetical protein N6H18_16630 [Reichenbachiella agarivorans]|uniref:Tetratricopeptide repeat-containing protein n=1 Tax=Reichenbachiella agarivorans TaxID=2979464 RepID=A0ABY6CN76_9BACT|nr:hypothetical protein [Reichenbachiella agarivorans]UXP31972.1 hypothetical protein N6H18_16630 [Reichenbachiella agarivorans]